MRLIVQRKLNAKELLKYLCPFEVEFKLKILANRNTHDYAILFQVKGDQPVIEDARDLEAFIAQITQQRPINAVFTATDVMYDGERYHCVYVDFPDPDKEIKV